MKRAGRFWTEFEIAQAVRLSREGYTHETIAKVIERPVGSVNTKIAAYKEMQLPLENDYYFQGRGARSTAMPKAAPRGLSTEDKYAWLAGWHDKDMELGVSVLEGVA